MPAKLAVPRTKEELRAMDRERGRRYRERHPGRARESGREWRAKHPGATTERGREWRKRHPGRQALLAKAWAEQHAEAATQWAREYYRANQEAIKERSRRHYRANAKAAYQKKRARLLTKRADPAFVETERAWRRAYSKRRHKANPERAAHKAKVARARRLGAEGRHTFEQWLARVAFHGWRCRYCRIPLDFGTLTQDHAIPLSRGGSQWPANLVPACMSCNCRKRTRTLMEFLEV